MNLGIKRLAAETDATRQYHLFDGAGTLVLVADQGSPWLTENRYHVRFARPDGQPMAVLDWPQARARRHRHGLIEQNYAIVLDDAVFAILTTFCRAKDAPAIKPTAITSPEAGATEAAIPDIAATDVAVAPAEPVSRLQFLTVDAADTRFLVMPPADGGLGADIYAGVPDGLAFYGTVDRAQLPEPAGSINTAISYTYIADIPPGTLPREELIVLALAYLLDDACQ